MGKKKDVKDLVPVNPAVLNGLPEEIIANLVVVIRDLETRKQKISDDSIARLVGISVAELRAIRQTPVYQKNVHSIIRSDLDLVRSVLRPHVVKVSQKIASNALKGNVKAQSLFMKILMQQKDRELTLMDRYIELLKDFNIQTQDEVNRNKILKSYGAESDAGSNEVIDAEYEEVELEDDSDMMQGNEETLEITEPDEDSDEDFEYIETDDEEEGE